MSLENWVTYIKDHGHNAYALPEHGIIMVETTFTYYDATGTIQAGCEWEALEPIMHIIQAWLGY